MIKKNLVFILFFILFNVKAFAYGDSTEKIVSYYQEPGKVSLMNSPFDIKDGVLNINLINNNTSVLILSGNCSDLVRTARAEDIPIGHACASHPIIKTINGLEALKNLKELYIIDFDYIDLSGFDNLTSLELTDVKDFAFNKQASIKRLYVNGNAKKIDLRNIIDLDVFGMMRGNIKSGTLDLSENNKLSRIYFGMAKMNFITTLPDKKVRILLASQLLDRPFIYSDSFDFVPAIIHGKGIDFSKMYWKYIYDLMPVSK